MVCDNEKLAIHQSDISGFLTCRLQWHWSSRLRDNLEPRVAYAPFFTGRAIHWLLERFYACRAKPDGVEPEPFDWEQELEVFLTQEKTLPPEDHRYEGEQTMIDEQLTLIRGIIPHFVEWEERQARVGGVFSLANLEALTVEQEFTVPIIHPITGEEHPRAVFSGKWDGLFRRKDTGTILIREDKTTRAIPSRAKQLVLEAQTSLYLAAAKQIFGDQVEGVLYTLIKKAIPPFPKVLLDGKLSADIKSQSLDSYINAIKKHHAIQIADLAVSSGTTEHEAFRQIAGMYYAAPILTLHNGVNQYFEKHFVRRSDAALNLTRLELWEVATAMTDPNVPIYRTVKEHCNYCTFRTPCITRQDGDDITSIMESEYRSRQLDDAIALEEV